MLSWAKSIACPLRPFSTASLHKTTSPPQTAAFSAWLWDN
uniref:Uncharacterized protein n=1 Tax=Anguilla anguilla TaxID=7936 RepID=A0A0E9XEX6_ANGAN